MIHVEDTNLLTAVTPRRFLLGLAAMERTPIMLVPTVVAECRRCLAGDEIRAWEARLVDSDLTAEQRDAVQIAAGAAARQWFDRELTTPEGPLAALPADDAEAELRAVRIRARMPADVFVLGTDEKRPTNDELIVAEALASGAEMLITNNTGSIRHGALNEWVVGSALRNRRFIYGGSDAMDALLGDDAPCKAHLIASCMTLAEQECADDHEAGSLIRFANLLKNSLGFAAFAALRYERDGHGRANRRAARRMIETESRWHEARQCEARRVAMVREAAREHGWLPEPAQGGDSR